MKILLLKTKEIIDCRADLALRKIEQGEAVPVKDRQQDNMEKTAAKAGDA